MKNILRLTIIIILACSACSSPTVSIRRATHEKQDHHITYASWGKAVNDADFTVARKMTDNIADVEVIDAFETLLEGDVDKARSIFKKTESEEHSYLESLMLPYYFYHGMHKECHALAKEIGNDLYSLSGILGTNPEPHFSWGADNVTLPILSFNYGGTPIIEVVLNGKSLRFIVDTGCSSTTISEETANECNIHQLEQSIPMIDANKSSSEASAGIAEQIILGDLSISHQPIFIVKNLSLDFFGISIGKMDGIIGWDILQQLNVVINWGEKYIRLSKPNRTRVNEPNLHAITSPFVTVRDEQGIKYYLHLDTGAKQTELFQKALDKGNLKYSKNGNKISFGVNSTKRTSSKRVKNFTLSLGQHQFNFDKIIATEESDISGFVKLDGRIGTDIFREGAIEIDYQAGYIRYLSKEGLAD